LDIPFIMIVHTQINSVLDVDSIISISWIIDHHFNLGYSPITLILPEHLYTS